MKYAIVDLGSNTIRLSLYNTLPDGRFELLFSQKEMAGLANYISDHCLSPGGILRACTALQSFQKLLKQFDIYEMRVFATASLRNIRNTEEAIAGIRSVTGLTVDVLSGDREAELSCRGSLLNHPMQDGAMFDIGGGSTELVELRNGEILKAQSLPMGSLNLFNRYVSKLWPKKSELEEIRREVNRTLADANLPAKEGRPLCGVGGTARAVLKIVNRLEERPKDSRTISRKELSHTAQVLLARDKTARTLILQACPDRLHTILPGIALMQSVCKALGGDEIYVSPYGVREGYLEQCLGSGRELSCE